MAKSKKIVISKDQLKEQQELLNFIVAGQTLELRDFLSAREPLLLQSRQEKNFEKMDSVFNEISLFLWHQELELRDFIGVRILIPGLVIQDPDGIMCEWDGSEFVAVKNSFRGRYLKIPHMVICPVCNRIRALTRKRFLDQKIHWLRVKGTQTPLEWFEKLYLKPCDACKIEYDRILRVEKDSRTCLQCGKPLPKGMSMKRKYCSDRCRTRYNRAKVYTKKLNE